MKKFNFSLLTVIFALTMVFALPCVLSAQSGKKGNINTALKFLNSASDKMKKSGDTDAEVLKLYNQAIEEFKRCTAVNNKDRGRAYHNLGIIYYTGPKSLQDYSEALNNLLSAKEIYENEKKPNADLLSNCYNRIGTLMYRVGDYYSCYDYLKKASALSVRSSGDEAQIYWLGLGVEQDLSKAMEIYRKAALSGRDLWANIYALDFQIQEYNKGNFDNDGMYLYMDYLNARTMGEPKDVWMSILKESADLNWPPAQVDYWIFCRDDKEYAKGMPYLQKAIDANFVPAYFHMGWIYHAGLNNTKINYWEAKKWYEKAATEGFPIAQSNLGALYYNNNISSENYSNQVMAAYWWHISADQGFSLAAQNLPLIASYRPPMSNLEASMVILKSVGSIISTSVKTYNSVNKSKVQGYVPPSGGAQRPAQSNTSTASSSSSSSSSSKTEKYCPSCKGSGNCDYKGFTGIGSYCTRGYIDCPTCSGKGVSSRDGKTCSECKGSKTVKCGVCHGSGKCSRCNGTGKI